MPAIQKAEKLIWKMLFKVALENMSVEDAIEQLRKTLPFEEIDQLSDAEDSVFRICKIPMIQNK